MTDTKQKTVIAFYSARHGSGKSTACAFLKEQLEAAGHTVEVLSFAAPLREFCKALIVAQYPNTTNDAAKWLLTEGKDDYIFEGWTVAPREHYLIPVGEAARATFGEDFWCDKLLEAIEKSPAEFILIDDMRRPNEYAALHELGAQMVLVIRPCDHTKGGGRSRIEGELANYAFPHIVVNYGGLEDLDDEVSKLLPENAE